jgi:uncharacterized protein
MQESQLKSSIQPFKLANKEGGVKFKWPVKALTRLSGMLYSDAGEVQVSVNAFFNDYKRCLLEAKITADLTLECQTTFEPIAHKVDKVTTFCAVANEHQFADVEEDFEPVLVEDGFLDFQQVIEDELILSIPLVSNKPSDEIDLKMRYGELDEAQIARDKQAGNPFSVLENLKKT